MLQVFENDDAAYERWLEQHPHGYVLNSRRNPTSSYLKLHTAMCHHITTLRPGYSQWTSGEYMKVCADRREEIAEWTATHVHHVRGSRVPMSSGTACSARRCACPRSSRASRRRSGDASAPSSIASRTATDVVTA